jgi:hypothetical protein
MQLETDGMFAMTLSAAVFPETVWPGVSNGAVSTVVPPCAAAGAAPNVARHAALAKIVSHKANMRVTGIRGVRNLVIVLCSCWMRMCSPG